MASSPRGSTSDSGGASTRVLEANGDAWDGSRSIHRLDGVCELKLNLDASC